MSDPNSPLADDIAAMKRQAAHEAVLQVQSGMVVGLGSGSTAWFALERIGELLERGDLEDIVGVPTSVAVEAEAKRLAIPLCDNANPPAIDVTIDGADEVDPQLNLIKGGGGAMVREKLVAQLSRRELIVIDETKLSPQLGSKCPLPVEVIEFGWQAQARFLEGLGAQVRLRASDQGHPYRTDQGHLILDAHFGPLDDPRALAGALEERSGIVGHGLFLNLASEVIVAGRDGVRHLNRR